MIEYVPSSRAEEGVNEKTPLLLAVVVPKVVPSEPLKRVKVTFELGSAFPSIVGVESFEPEIFTKDDG